jgi:hypothetical protein
VEEALRKHPVLVGLLVVGLAGSLFAGWQRHRVESAYRTVEVVLDGEDWRLLALREGRLGSGFWQELKARGAGSVAVYEATLRRLQDEGRLTYRSGAELLDLLRAGGLNPALRGVAASAEPGAVYVLPADPEVARQVWFGFRTALGPERVAAVLREPLVLRVRGRLRDLEETGLGFLPSSVRRWEALGFRVVLRPRNVRSFTAERLQERVGAQASLLRGRTVVFDLNEVLGYERLVEDASRALQAAGAVYGRVEVLTPARRIRGEDAMTRFMRPHVVRVVSIPPEELERLPVEDAVERFARGVRERNLRVLYVRPYLQTPGGVDAVAFNLDYLARVVQAVRSAGFQLGPARPLPELALSHAARWAAVAASTASGVLLAAVVGRALGKELHTWAGLGLGAAGLVAAAAGQAVGFGLWVSKLWALMAAVAFPTMAVLRVAPRVGGGGVGQAVGALWEASAFSALGGFVVAALLSDWTFRLAADGFLGVKLATVGPALLAAGAWTALGDDGGHSGTGRLVRRVRAWLERPVTLGAVLAVAVVAGLGLLLLLRTGNTGLPLPPGEERLREALERALVARPRTKEYLLGHPALVLAVASGAVGLRAWSLPLVVVGAVGQAGLVNSFSHAHTPLLYTVWRTANGLVLGTLVGVGVYALLRGVQSGLVRARAAGLASPAVTGGGGSHPPSRL